MIRSMDRCKWLGVWLGVWKGVNDKEYGQDYKEVF